MIVLLIIKIIIKISNKVILKYRYTLWINVNCSSTIYNFIFFKYIKIIIVTRIIFRMHSLLFKIHYIYYFSSRINTLSILSRRFHCSLSFTFVFMALWKLKNNFSIVTNEFHCNNFIIKRKGFRCWLYRLMRGIFKWKIGLVEPKKYTFSSFRIETILFFIRSCYKLTILLKTYFRSAFW